MPSPSEYFHSNFKNMISRDYIGRTADSYTEVDVVNPLDQSIIKAYDVKEQFKSALTTIDRTDPDL